LRISLSFLDEGSGYRATIYRDGQGAGFEGDPKSIEISSRPVSRHDILTLELAAGGGQAVRFAAKRGRADTRVPAKLPKRKSRPEFDVE
jgi:alpha-glucosidase